MTATSSPRATMNVYRPIKIGLTGSIGMGKSAVSRQFKALGFRVFDADAAVHRLYSPRGPAGGLLAPHFPSAVLADGSVDRQKLSSLVLCQPKSLKLLESVVHPLVVAERHSFYEKATSHGCLAVVYDIPLLLEQRHQHDVDYVVVVTASSDTQRTRVLSRPNMTLEKFESILVKQMPDAEKRQLADFVINTDYPGFGEARSQVARFIDMMIEQHAEVFETWKQRGRAPAGSNSSSSSSSEALVSNNYLRQMFDMIVFDLDDTLVPVMGPIQDANRSIKQFIDSNMSQSAPIIHEHLASTLKSVSEANPLIAHDYTALRTIALTELCQNNKEEAHLVTEAIEIFVAARSGIDYYLYPDSLPCLQHIAAQGLPIGLFTNGNAKIPALFSTTHKEEGSTEDSSNGAEKGHSSSCLDASGSGFVTLSSLLSLSLNAGDVGAQKPSMVPFIALSQLSNIPPSRILYVGDNFQHDVEAAQQANFHAVYLRRNNLSDSVKVDSGRTNTFQRGCSKSENVSENEKDKSSTEEKNKQPGHSHDREGVVAKPFIELNSLDTYEFASKVQAYIAQIQSRTQYGDAS